ncbi:MAG: hypothetical protein P8183_00685 [Anaerolineae bacterium]
MMLPGKHILISVGTAVIVVFLLLSLFHQNEVQAVAGDPVPAIDCGGVYTATVYAEGLSSPDGLAFGPDGLLYVAQETAGVVSQVDASGVVTNVLSGLSSPEGVAFDDAGNLYVVEDVLTNARLIRRSPAGVTTTLTSDLVGPEGVVVADDGTVYVTESNIQEFVATPADAANARSYVTAVSPSIGVTRIVTSQPQIVSQVGFNVYVEFLSFSAITLGNDGLLYVANETSGYSTSVDQPPFTVIVTTTKSITTVDPLTGASTLFASNLIGVEGVRFSVGNQFPLLATEEDVNPDDPNVNGRLSQVAANGDPSVVCTGFGTIEDVLVDDWGRLYVSEDVSGNGRVIFLDNGLPRQVYLPMLQKP